MDSKLSEEQNHRKVSKFLYNFLTTPDEVEKYVEIMQSKSYDKYVHCFDIGILNPFDIELQLINTKPIIINKLIELISVFEKFKFQTILV